MAEQPIYTGPGTAPVGIDAGAATSGLAGLFGGIGSYLDLPGFLIRAATKILPAIDMFGAEMTDSKPLGQEFAAQVEKAIPQDFFAEGAENLALFGQREQIAEQTGEGPFLAGRLTGGIGLPLALAMKATKAFQAFDVFTDIATATPSRQIMEGAQSLPQIIGKGAQIGGLSSIPAAIDLGYNAQSNTANPMAAGLTLAGGTALGAGLPAVIGGVAAIPQVGKSLKQALDGTVQGVSNFIKQSDNTKAMQDISKAAFEREQMVQFAKAQEENFTQAYKPEPVAEPVIEAAPTTERTFAKEVPSYEEQPNITKMQEEDLIQLANDESKITQEFQVKIAKQEEELDTLSKFIEEARTKPIEVDDVEINTQYKGPKSQKEVVDNLRTAKKQEIETQKTKIKEEFDTALNAQTTLKQKQKNLVKIIKEKTPEELTKQFNKPIEQVQKDLDKQIVASEKTLDKIGRELSSIDKKLEKTIPVKKPEVEAEMAKFEQEKQVLREELLKQKETEQQKLIQDLEKEAEGLFGKYEKTKQGYETKLGKVQKQRQEVESFAPKPQLPALRQPDPPQPKPRFIAGRQGIKEYNPETGLPVPIKETPTVTEEGDIIVPGLPKSTDEQWLESFGARSVLDSSKHKSEFTTIRSKVMRTNKQVGGKLISHAYNKRNYKQQLREELKPLKSAVVKYQNDDTVMAVLGEVTSGRASADLLPKDLREPLLAAREKFNKVYDFLSEAGYELPKKLDTYFPFRVKDFKKLLEVGGEEARLVQQYLDETGIADLTKLSEENKLLLQGKLEKARAQQKYTPEKMAAYKSMPEALESYIDQVSTGYADAMLFGGKMQRPRGELYADLLLKTPGVTPEQAPQLYNLIGRYFGGKDFIASAPFKTVRSAISLFLLTGYKTSLAQLSSHVMNASKFGLFEAAEGALQVVKLLTGKSPSFAKKLGIADMPQDLNDFGIESVDQLMTFIKNQRATPIEKLGKAGKVASFKLLQGADLMEKESTLGASYSWLKRHVDKKDFSVFEDRYQGVFTPGEFKQLKQELLRLRDPKNKEAMSPLVFKAIDTLGGERIPVGDLDKTGGALGGEYSRLFHGLQTFAYKTADDVYDNTIQLTKEAIQEKNPEKALFAARYAMGFATVLVPGLTYWNHLRGGDSSAQSVEATFNPNELIATGGRTATPIGARVADLVASGVNINSGTQLGGQILNFVSPGSSTSLKVLGDTGKSILSGENPFDLNSNPSSKRLPPAIINEAVYNLSAKKREDDAAKKLRQSPTLQKEKLKKDLKYVMEHPKAAPENIEDIESKGFKKQLSKFKTVRSRLEKYQTDDPLDAARRQIYEAAFPEAERMLQLRLEHDLRSGKINQAKYNQVLENSSDVIIKMLDKKWDKGQL